MSEFTAHNAPMVLPWSFILVILAVGAISAIILQNVLGRLANNWTNGGRRSGHHQKKKRGKSKRRGDSDSDDSGSDSD